MTNSFGLLLREFGQFLLHIGPRLLPFDNALDRCTDGLLVRSYLLHAIPIAQRKGVVFERLKVDGDTERSAQFVVSRVALADGGGGVVDPARYSQLSQFLAHPPDQWSEVGVAGQRDKEHLGRGNRGGKRKHLLSCIRSRSMQEIFNAHLRLVRRYLPASNRHARSNCKIFCQSQMPVQSHWAYILAHARFECVSRS